MNNYKSLAIVLTSITMFSCAIPQGIYQTTQGGTLHPEFPVYNNLDCTELSAQRNKMKELLVEVAEGAIEESDRSTYSFALGMGTNNPTTGKNFRGPSMTSTTVLSILVEVLFTSLLNFVIINLANSLLKT